MRKPTDDSITRAAIEVVHPELKGQPQKYEALWEELYEAAKAKTITEALAIVADRDPRLVLEIHKRNPWTPSPDEATILQAFFPNYFMAGLRTYSLGISDRDVPVTFMPSKFGAHLEKMCEELYKHSVRELEANRPGAFGANSVDM